MPSERKPMSKEERAQRLKEHRLHQRFQEAIGQARERLRQKEKSDQKSGTQK
jgi:hypothetical protein